MPIIQGPASIVHFNDALFEGDTEFLAEILKLFLETCPELILAVEDSISRRDAALVRRTAHTLKGSVANFGARQIVERAQELETIGLSGDLSHAEEVWLGLKDLMDELLLELRATLANLNRT